MAILANYTIQCRDILSGETGCFLFDTDHWQRTGEFKATSPVFPSLPELYANTRREDRHSVYLERATIGA
jgi:hypothetical protein